MNKTKSVTPLYMLMGIIFTTCLLISNIIANRLFQIGPWSLTAAVLIFPITYILNDVIAEVYGFKAARRIMWTGFVMNAFMVGMFYIVISLPAPVWFSDSAAYATVLGNTPRLFAASMIAYVMGSWVNATVISKMKVSSKGKGFGFRAVLSTLLGESIDSLIFIPIAFLGLMPFNQLLIMMALQVSFKTLYEIVVLPLTTIIVKKVKVYEGIDVYDTDVKHTLFN